MKQEEKKRRLDGKQEESIPDLPKDVLGVVAQFANNRTLDNLYRTNSTVRRLVLREERDRSSEYTLLASLLFSLTDGARTDETKRLARQFINQYDEARKNEIFSLSQMQHLHLLMTQVEEHQQVISFWSHGRPPV